MTTLFQANRESMLEMSYRGKNVLPVSETFHREAIEALLNVDGCAAIRIYYGQDEDDEMHAILVAVDDSNEDILPQALNEEDEPVIIEVGQRCPPSCPPSSALNP
ncbi:MAG: hypothetical protein EOO04_22210 [Chitinophagaceae bacterium]|nr:MAG: hypothetical protein EOO04_22210 [Chitinophagaceae bacterium]